MTYIDTLISNCHKAKAAKPTNEFELTDDSSIVDIKQAIYIIEEICGDKKQTFAAMDAYKKRKERACPKLNAPSQVLYVGSTTTGLLKRIEQHRGNGPAQTYALHLSHWFTGKYKITVKTFDEPAEVLQIIEDALAHDLKPAFGKTGGNNR